MNVHVIVNPAAGFLQTDNAQEVQSSFERHPQVKCTLHPVRHPEAVSRYVSEAIDSGADVIVAGGGDGTVSSVVNLIAEKSVVLGVLPLGSLNHLAKDLNIPLDLDEAVDVICEGKTMAMDLGEVNGRFFVNNVSIGAYPKALYIRDQWRQYIGKWPAMAAAFLVMLVSFSWFPIRLESDGKTKRRLVPLLLVGNNAYSTTWPDLGSRPVLDSGHLWVLILKKVRVLRRFWVMFLALLGKLEHVEEAEIIETPELVVRSYRRRIAAGIDGERVKLTTPVTVKSHHKALQVRVPLQ
jgi:YegS/Rv2252/BmrU family lipid kinase